jgi:ATP-dependent exoDNAse (exonuclease V) beta subunit
MTIHSAKGLEFDAVILPELHKPFVARHGRRLLEERPAPDGPIEMVTVSPGKNLVRIDDALASLYDAATARIFEDGLCTLYVAMTRAKYRLDLIVPALDAKQQERAEKGKKSTAPKMAEFVRAALLQGDVEADDDGVLWQHSDSAAGTGWAADLEAPGRADAEPLAALGSLGLAPSARPRTIPRRSPSAEEGGQRVAARTLLGAKRRAQRGTLVHHWLEDLQWLEDFEIDEGAMLESAARIEPDEARRREALDMLLRALGGDEVAAALSRAGNDAPAGAAFEVRPEHAFCTVLPDEQDAECLWKGYVDRLVLGRREGEVVWADVVDYKTDAVGAEGLADLVTYYRPQLERYRDVIVAQYDLAPDAIRMRLVFLSPGPHEPGRVVDL